MKHSQCLSTFQGKKKPPITISDENSLVRRHIYLNAELLIKAKEILSPIGNGY